MVSVWGVNLLESLGIHFIILMSPDNLRAQAILMELGQLLFKLLFLHCIPVSQDLNQVKKKNDKIPLRSVRGFKMLDFDFTHFSFFQTCFCCLFICFVLFFLTRIPPIFWGLQNYWGSNCLFLSYSPSTSL